MKKCQKIYQYVNQLIVALLKESNCPELCLRLFLEAALNAAKSAITDYESISYEFISQAFSIYEDEISDSKEQTLCLLLIITTVKNVKFDNIENFTPLRNQCCLNCGMDCGTFLFPPFHRPPFLPSVQVNWSKRVTSVAPSWPPVLSS